MPKGVRLCQFNCFMEDTSLNEVERAMDSVTIAQVGRTIDSDTIIEVPLMAAVAEGAGVTTVGCELKSDAKKKTRKKTREPLTLPAAIVGGDLARKAADIALERFGVDFDRSLLLLDLGHASRKAAEWRHRLPRVVPHYAVKCNPDKKMLQRLSQSGCNFDCATMEEIARVLALGASPDDIVFSHPCKLRSHLRFAQQKGVRLMSFDNAVELRKVAAEFPGARLLLRVVCDDSSAQCPMSLKFGAARNEWVPLLDLAVELGLNFVGVSFHVGSGCKEPDSFLRAVGDAREIIKLAMDRGFQAEVLDIGGGFPGSDSPDVTFATLAARISEALDQFFPDNEWPELLVMAEPGRFFASSSASLLTKVFAKAVLPTGENVDDVSCDVTVDTSVPTALGSGVESFRYYLNDGLYGSFNCILYDHATVEPELIKLAAGPPKPCCMFGPTCDGFDMILKDTKVPELDEGDWLLWRNMGAYTVAAGSGFNGFPPAKVWYYDSDVSFKPLSRCSTTTATST